MSQCRKKFRFAPMCNTRGYNITCDTHCYSTGGHAVGEWPSLYFYTATKYAVTALTEGLRKELREIKSNIKITVSSSRSVLLPV